MTQVLAELRHRNPLPEEQSTPVPEPTTGEVADAIARLDARDGRASGPHRIAPRAGSRDLSDLVAPGSLRDQLDLVEGHLDRGDYAAAVRDAAAAWKELATRIVGAAAQGGEEAGPLAALLTGVPASRWLRFREVAGRVEQDGAVSSTDALFTLFFLCDVALRLEERARA
jgi:hypothetical protein